MRGRKCDYIAIDGTRARLHETPTVASPFLAMTTPHVTDAVLHVIKGAGYSLGETTTINRDGTTSHVINAVDARTGESFTVSAGTLYEAVVELAGQVGIELGDG